MFSEAPACLGGGFCFDRDLKLCREADVFERKPALDLIRGGYRFAQRKRIKTKQ